MIPITESRSCRSQDGRLSRRRPSATPHRLQHEPAFVQEYYRTAATTSRLFMQGQSPLRHFPIASSLASQASGISSPSRGASFRRDLGDIALEKFFLSPRLLADTSKGPCDKRPCVVQPTEFRSVAVSAARRDGAFVRDVVWLSEPPDLLPPQPVVTVSRNSAKHQHFPPLRRRSRHPRAASLPTSDESPVRMHFLLVA